MMLVGASNWEYSMILWNQPWKKTGEQRGHCVSLLLMVSLMHSWSEQLGTTSDQPGEEEEMNTTEGSCAVLKFSGAQVSPHSYTHVQGKME